MLYLGMPQRGGLSVTSPRSPKNFRVVVGFPLQLSEAISRNPIYKNKIEFVIPHAEGSDVLIPSSTGKTVGATSLHSYQALNNGLLFFIRKYQTKHITKAETRRNAKEGIHQEADLSKHTNVPY